MAKTFDYAVIWNGVYYPAGAKIEETPVVVAEKFTETTEKAEKATKAAKKHMAAEKTTKKAAKE